MQAVVAVVRGRGQCCNGQWCRWLWSYGNRNQRWSQVAVVVAVVLATAVLWLPLPLPRAQARCAVFGTRYVMRGWVARRVVAGSRLRD